MTNYSRDLSANSEGENLKYIVLHADFRSLPPLSDFLKPADVVRANLKYG